MSFDGFAVLFCFLNIPKITVIRIIMITTTTINPSIAAPTTIPYILPLLPTLGVVGIVVVDEALVGVAGVTKMFEEHGGIRVEFVKFVATSIM